MRVLLLSQYFWPESFQINFIAKLLAERIHLDVFTGKPNYPEGSFYKGHGFFGVKFEKLFNFTITRIPILPRKKNRFSLILNYISFTGIAIFLLPWVMRKKRYDVIFVYGVSPIFQVIPAIFFGYLRNIPVVLWVQDLWPESAVHAGKLKSKILISILKKLVSFCYSRSSLILVQSEDFVDSVMKLSPKSKVEYHPNTVDEIFMRNNLSGKFVENRHSSEFFSVVFAGNIGEAQSIETIVSAAELLAPFSNIRFLFVGSGSKDEWLRRQIEEKKLTNVEFKGRHPLEEMPLILESADLMLVTLKDADAFNKTIPNKIQAYLAIGKPIVGSLNGAGAELIKKSGAGFAAPAQDAKSLSDIILRFSNMNDEELLNFSQNARCYFENNFEPNFLIDRLLAHFNSVRKEL